MSEPKNYSLEELSRMTGLTRRTIRFYIQKGLIPTPCGKNKGSYYTNDHLEALLRVKRLTEKHVPLNEIRSFNEDNDAKPAGPAVGSITVCSHIHLGNGLTLVVDPKQSELNADQLRMLASRICEITREELDKKGD